MAVTSFPLLVIPCKVGRESLFKKGTPASATNRHRGWHGAVSAPCTAAIAGHYFTNLAHREWARFNFLKRRAHCKKDEGQGDKQDKNSLHGVHPPYPLAPCRAHGGRATVQACYSWNLVSSQSFSPCLQAIRNCTLLATAQCRIFVSVWPGDIRLHAR